MKQNRQISDGRQRIQSIDSLRGLAILGILLVNMPDFHSPFLHVNPIEWWNNDPDRTIYIMVDLFAQASFYPMFAFLFGFGAVILAERVQSRNTSFPVVFSRRLFFLLIIGCIHAFLIWHGDILINYALIGFLFLLFYKMSGKTLLWVGSLLFAIPALLLCLLMMVVYVTMPEEAAIITDLDMVQASIKAYQTGTFTEIFQQRFVEWYMVNNLGSSIILIISIFPLFLIGAGFAKLKWLERTREHQRKLTIITVVCLVCGGLLKASPYIADYNYFTVSLQDMIGGPVISIFYITALVLLMQNKSLAKILTPLANVGRLSMSNYLLQSIIGTLLFYSYGFGLYGKISFTTGVVLVVVIYFLQLILSTIWLKHYYMGPVEYVWRFATYGTRPMMKK
ncbi:DUF418 domain-containing protein [Peribacillus huizhouensis]|uniref:DUF418 domain-containing protein n=1 Tax=Peribacillus huizhouensis TaxID=1501239 RepID=A0ABR6CJI8_9BACI|nr:DUF418 domain-containing protein [Peribacillus huizhouensis]MBA9025229.1 uncharacterized protein [Peribacillus huizhouensis]